MLVLTRKLGDSIQIGDNISVTVVAISGQRTRLAISAPRETSIARAEILATHDDTPMGAGASSE